MKIGIVGSGAIGLYYGARLARSGEDVHFLARSDFDSIKENGIEVKLAKDSFVVNPVPVYDNVEAMGVCDLVIVGLKTTANQNLPSLLDPLVGENTRILTLQNGLGSDSLIAERYGAAKVLGALCFVCLNRIAPGCVENTHLGSLAMGNYRRPADDFAKELGAKFKKAGIRCSVVDDLQLTQWKKLVWNIPFNGLAIAAGGVTTDVIMGDEGLQELAGELMEEIIAGAVALGMTMDSKMIATQMKVTLGMKAYKPSSLIDFMDGKPVEVESIWGEAYRQGKDAGVDMPRLGMLYRLLSALCEK